MKDYDVKEKYTKRLYIRDDYKLHYFKKLKIIKIVINIINVIELILKKLLFILKCYISINLIINLVFISLFKIIKSKNQKHYIKNEDNYDLKSC